MSKTNKPTGRRTHLGKASRITRGATGYMIEAGGLWGHPGLSRD